MQSRLLIINCPSDYFLSIPMGTFGLCHYLDKKDIPAKILNLALYRETELDGVLKHYLELFQPTHVGLILHWQETAEGFLRVGKKIKTFRKDARIIGGGFTAGHFGKDLLEKCRFLDFAVKGDPEKPLELLLGGEEPSGIPNLLYRSASRVRSSEETYFIDKDTLSRISFSGLTYLYDYELYIRAIERKLGFPLFIGRGCVHGCRYCGGSCSAFRSHSGRLRPVARTLESVISDLKRLKEFTRRIYLCFENDPDYIKELFRAIKKEDDLRKSFHLNYGAWQLVDREFLELYKELFVSLGNMKPVFELSPEVFDDEGRRRIKNGSVYYSIGKMQENLSLIESHLGDRINVSIFFSRYHDTAKTYAGMKKEITDIFRFGHDLLCRNITNVKIFYDHLSTDVASSYWEDYVKRPRDFNTLISAIRRLKAREPQSFPAGNLCVYIPETLSESEIFRCELLVFILETLEKHAYELFHIMFKCLDEKIVDVIEDIISEFYVGRPGNVFTSFDHCELLNLLEKKIAGDETLLEKIPFIGDLIALTMRKIEGNQQPVDLRAGYQKERPKLREGLISVHAHDYLDLQRFLKRLDKEGSQDLKTDRTVYLFLVNEILSMTHETFRMTLKEFDKGISIDDYYALMKERGIFTRAFHEELVDKLFRAGVLGH